MMDNEIPDARMTKYIRVLCTDAQHAEWTRQSKDAGISTSEFVRACLNGLALPQRQRLRHVDPILIQKLAVISGTLLGLHTALKRLGDEHSVELRSVTVALISIERQLAGIRDGGAIC